MPPTNSGSRVFHPAFQGFEVTPGVYTLVPVKGERYLTARHQQQRACNLASWLAAQPNPPVRVGVVGGGLAGLTFAADYLRRVPVAKLRVLERNSELLATMRASPNRWLHPYFFSWPEKGWKRKETDLPVLNWEATMAKHVVQTVHDSWKATRIPADTRTRIKQISREGGDIVVITQEMPGYGAEMLEPRRREFDAVVLAVGPGTEREHSGASSGSYWGADNLDQVTPGLVSYVIAGSGDGALTDLLRLCFSGFVNHDAIQIFADRYELTRLLQRVDQGEELGPDERNELATILEQDYGMRKDTAVILVTPEETLFESAFKINRLLARCLHVVKRFEVRKGKTLGAAEWVHHDRVTSTRHRKPRIVLLDDAEPLFADHFVPRVGTIPPAVIEPEHRVKGLTDIESAIDALQQAAWEKDDPQHREASAERAKPLCVRHRITSSRHRVEVKWCGLDSLTVGGVEVRFALSAPQSSGSAASDARMWVAGEPCSDGVLLEDERRETFVGVLPSLSSPQAVSDFEMLWSAGARLFIVGELEAGSTLESWGTAGFAFQLVAPSTSAEELRAAQPFYAGAPEDFADFHLIIID